MKTVPTQPDALLGALPSDCDAIVRSCFPAQDPELHYNQFIIADELTEKEKTVIIAENDENEGGLILIRCNFKAAVISFKGAENTSLTMDLIADSAAKRSSGISIMP